MNTDVLIRHGDTYLNAAGERVHISRAESFQDMESAEAVIASRNLTAVATAVRAPTPALQDFEFASAALKAQHDGDWEMVATYFIAVIGHTPYRVWIKLTDDGRRRIGRTLQSAAQTMMRAAVQEAGVAIGRVKTTPLDEIALDDLLQDK